MGPSVGEPPEDSRGRGLAVSRSRSQRTLNSDLQVFKGISSRV